MLVNEAYVFLSKFNNQWFMYIPSRKIAESLGDVFLGGELRIVK